MVRVTAPGSVLIELTADELATLVEVLGEWIDADSEDGDDPDYSAKVGALTARLVLAGRRADSDRDTLSPEGFAARPSGDLVLIARAGALPDNRDVAVAIAGDLAEAELTRRGLAVIL